MNKPLGTDLQHLYARLDELQGGRGGPPPSGALGGLGAGGPSALFGLGGPAAPGAGGVLPSGSGEREGMAAAAAAAAGNGEEDEDIPAESLQQVGQAAVTVRGQLGCLEASAVGRQHGYLLCVLSALLPMPPSASSRHRLPCCCFLAPTPTDGRLFGLAQPAGFGSSFAGRRAAAAGGRLLCAPSAGVLSRTEEVVPRAEQPTGWGRSKASRKEEDHPPALHSLRLPSRMSVSLAMDWSP